MGGRSEQGATTSNSSQITQLEQCQLAGKSIWNHAWIISTFAGDVPQLSGEGRVERIVERIPVSSHHSGFGVRHRNPCIAAACGNAPYVPTVARTCQAECDDRRWFFRPDLRRCSTATGWWPPWTFYSADNRPRFLSTIDIPSKSNAITD